MSHQINEIAIISDIHSNIFALDAVLEHITQRGIDTILNLGDTLFGPIAPVETAQRIMENPNVISIMGNCDRLLLEEKSDSLTFQQVKPLLTPAILAWIESLPKTWVSEDILFCHGTPYSDEEYLMEEVTVCGAVPKAVGVLTAELQAVPQNIIVCGHTHLQKSMYLPDGKWIINPGSVGFPAYYEEAPYPHVMESMSPHAKYAILRRSREEWTLEQVMLPYDWEHASKMAEARGRMDYAYAIRNGFAYDLQRVSLREP